MPIVPQNQNKSKTRVAFTLQDGSNLLLEDNTIFSLEGSATNRTVGQRKSGLYFWGDVEVTWGSTFGTWG